jgi:hypothetical protein
MIYQVGYECLAVWKHSGSEAGERHMGFAPQRYTFYNLLGSPARSEL